MQTRSLGTTGPRVSAIGLSDVGPETLPRATAIHPIVDVQIEYSLPLRGVEVAILPACRALGIGVPAYGALARGLLGALDLDLGPADLAPIEAAVQKAHLDREAPQA
jgi:aryl-alcohol dehydrogenase-like predicted oxidoreductase